MRISSIDSKAGKMPRSGCWKWLMACLALGFPFPASARTYYAVLMGGADANVDLQACVSAVVAGGGGTCDARGFGAATETISDTVSLGASGKQVTLLFDPATTFVPAAANTTLFSLGAQAVVSGLHIDTTRFPAYSVPAIVIPGPTYAQEHFSLSNAIIVGNTASPSPGSACLALTSSDSSTPVQFVSVQGLRCVGNYDGVLLEASGTGYVNANMFDEVSILNSTYGIEIYGGGSSSQASGNSFTNVQVEASGGTTALYLHGAAVGNHIVGISVYDGPSPSCLISGSDAKQNSISGWLQNGCSDTTGNLPPYANVTNSMAQASSFTVGTEGGPQNWLAFLPSVYGDSTYYAQNGANIWCLSPSVPSRNSLLSVCLDNSGHFTVPTLEANAFTGTQSVTISPAAAAGTGASAACDTADGVQCTQAYGIVKLVTGTSPSAGDLFTVNWGDPFQTSSVSVFQSLANTFVVTEDRSALSTTSVHAYAPIAPASSSTYYVAYHTGN